MIETYDTLKEIEEHVVRLEENLMTKENTLEGLEKIVKKYDGERQLLEKRKEIEDRKLTIENSLKWQKFTALKKVVKETRNKERECREGIDKMKEERARIEKPL